jgi:tetratricopeptide (TPR) repeat protein
MIVGDNALLYATLGQAHLHYLEAGLSADPAHMREAERCARCVFDLDPGSAHGHGLSGWIHFKRGEMEAAIQELERARTLDPNNPEALLLLAYGYLITGNDRAGREAAAAALAVDPLTPIVQAVSGFARFLQGRFDEALPHYRRFLAMDPHNPAARWFLIWTLALAGRTDEVPALVEALERDVPGTVVAALARAFERAIRGDRRAAALAITPELKAAAAHTEHFARGLSECFALMGDHDAAIESLELALRQGFSHYPFLAEHDRFLAPLRSDPRFLALLERIRERWARRSAE